MNQLKAKKEKLICHVKMKNSMHLQLEYIRNTPVKLFFWKIKILFTYTIEIVWSFQHDHNIEASIGQPSL